MSALLPAFGLASDLLDLLEAEAEQPLARYVDSVAPPARAAAPVVEPPIHLVTFLLDGGLHALPVERVREIVRVQGLARVPQAPPHVRGVQSLRGALLPVLEVRTRLGLAPAPFTPDSRVLVCEGRERLLGLLVDAASQVVRLPRSAVEPPPPEVVSRLSRFVAGVARVGEAMALLLDLEALLLLPRAEEARPS